MAIGSLFVWGGLVMHSLVGGNMVGWCRSFMGRNEKKNGGPLLCVYFRRCRKEDGPWQIDALCFLRKKRS